MTCGNGEGSDQVDVDVGEPALRDGNWEGLDLDMPVDLGLLAFCAVFGPRGDVSVDACPNKPGTQKSFCGQSAGVCDVVDAVEDGAAVAQRHQGPPCPCGCVAGQPFATYGLKRNG